MNNVTLSSHEVANQYLICTRSKLLVSINNSLFAQSLHLSLGGPNRAGAQSPLLLPPPPPTAGDASPPPIKNQHLLFAKLGLGYGVDISDPSPLKTRRRIVRTVLPDFCNSEESVVNQSCCYKNSILSSTKRSASFTASVSDIVGKVVQLSAEAEYARVKSNEMKVKGMPRTQSSYCADS